MLLTLRCCRMRGGLGGAARPSLPVRMCSRLASLQVRGWVCIVCFCQLALVLNNRFNFLHGVGLLDARPRSQKGIPANRGGGWVPEKMTLRVVEVGGQLSKEKWSPPRPRKGLPRKVVLPPFPFKTQSSKAHGASQMECREGVSVAGRATSGP